MSVAGGPALGARAEAGGVRFSAWSDRARAIAVVTYGDATQITGEVPLAAQGESGLFCGFVPQLGPGALYRFRIDGQLASDPYARALPYGVHGPARVMGDLPAPKHGKRAIDLEHNEVFYELHVGTFTDKGTFAGALERLQYLRELGVTVIELMPIAAFAGKRGWGYDGVALFAPFAGYGTPEELASLIDAAHGHGLSVVLDVVYNHLGPDGNALPQFSDSYFEAERSNPWGRAPAFEKPAFRQLVLSNAAYWLNTFGFDGLRLDATHELEPGGDPHLLQDLSRVARACQPPAVLVAEDNRNDPVALLAHGIDAVWSDDFHHVLHVLFTREQEGYYRMFSGELLELARVIERGQLYEGQTPPGSSEPRGKAANGVPARHFVFALQNHDQIGNRARGERLHHLLEPAAFRAASLLLTFLPETPLLFMGQEWAASSPFVYFSDHLGELGAAVSRGRREEFRHFSAFRGEGAEIPDPQAEASFLASKLDWAEQARGEQHVTLELYRRALELRRTDPVLRTPCSARAGVAHDCLWVLRGTPGDRRLLIFNPGEARSFPSIGGHSPRGTQPLLASFLIRAFGDQFELPACSALWLTVVEPAQVRSA